MRTAMIAVVVATLAASAFTAVGRDYNYDMTAYVTCSSHIDAIWKWLEPESREIVYNTWSSLAGLMYLYDGLMPGDNPVHYIQSTPAFYEWMEQDHPELMENVRYWYDQGQWHIAGGTYVEMDAQIPSGESLCRQFLYGQRYFMEHFGRPTTMGFLPDSFGYPATLPMIMEGAGIEGFVTSKINWNDTNVFPFHLFDWIGPDGSSVPTYLTVGQYSEYIDEEILKARMRKMQDFHPDVDALQLYLGVGDHGGGVFKPWIDRMVGLRDEENYDIVFGSNEDFFERLESEPIDNWWSDELYLEWHRGVYTNRAEVKERNRRAELDLEATEKLWVAASDLGGAWPRAALDEAWRVVLFNQFHDVLPGSAVDEYYSDQYQRDMGRAESILAELLLSGMESLAAGVDTSFAEDLDAPLVYVVFNPLSFKRDAVLTIETDLPSIGWQAYSSSGEPLLTQWSEDSGLLVLAKDLPPLGWSSIAVKDEGTRQPGGAQVDGLTLTNGLVSATLDPATGHVVSVTDLVSGVESIEPGRAANVVQLYKEGRDIYPAWNLAYDKYNAEPETVDDVRSIDVIEPGPVRAALRVTRKHEELTIVQDVILEAGSDHVRFETRIDNWGQVPKRLAKVAFPLNLENSAAQAVYDIPYGTLVRTHDESPPDNHEAIGHKWVAIQDSAAVAPGRGVAILSANKYGFDIQNDRNGRGLSDGRANILRVTLLKACPSPTLGDMFGNQGGPIGDVGNFTSIYGLRPYTGSWADADMPQAGWEFNMKPLVVKADVHAGAIPADGSWAIVEPANVMLTALKRPWEGPDQGHVIVRLFETDGLDSEAVVTLPGRKILSAGPVDLIERPIESPQVQLTDDNGCKVSVGRNSLITLLMEVEPLGNEPYEGDEGDDSGGACGCD